MAMLGKDLKEVAVVERRRRYEDERKARIFNPRKRTIGVDEAALRMQIDERKAREEEEQKLDEAFEHQQLRDAHLAMSLEKQTEEEKFRVNKAIDTFRSVYQCPEQRREFDLYDPDALKKSLPARISDDDPRCTVSSAQRFAGEDLASKERLRAQMQQQRAWLEQQMTERQAAEKECKAAEDTYQEALATRDKSVSNLEKMEQECRRRLNKAILQFNMAMAEEQEAQRRLDEMRDLEDKRAEMHNLMTSDLLTENVDVAKSNLGEHRRVGYMYKGMTPDEVNEVRKGQLQQIEEEQARKAAEDTYNAQWDKFTADMSHLVMLKDRELVQKQREISKNTSHHNRILSEEHKSRREYFDKVVYTNKPTPEYFQQFNTTSR